MRPIAMIAALGIAVGLPVAAEERVLTLDPAASEIRFTLGATLHKVEGSIRVEGGEIRFDPQAGTAGGEIVADATSAETGNKGRDKDMHKKVLESAEFGRFVLRPTGMNGALEPTGTSSIELSGELEIHGSVHPVTLPAEVTIDGDRLTGTATLEVPYVEWGMKDPSKLVLRVAKAVQVEIVMAGTLADVPAPGV